jgi:nudix-type nucleoside diphosphatase (YffH/AdpP family)
VGAPVFFYGTLRYLPLLEIVLGRPITCVDATLEGYCCLGVAREPFPMLVPQEGSRARGVVLRDLSETDIARLDFYEGGFDYALEDVVLSDGKPAQVYLCPSGRWQVEGAWDFEKWSAHWAAMSCHAAREVMDHYGTLSRDDVAKILPEIRARAWSTVLGERTPPTADVLDGKVEVLRRSRAYTGYFALDEVALRHQLFDGGMSQALERSCFIGGDAALVLPYDPVRDLVLVVEQMRMGPLVRGDPSIWHLEPIAGRIDPGEEPEQTALREAREEAGLVLDRLETVARGYPSPGDSTTYFHIFVAIANLPDNVTGIGGVETEAENIRSRLISFPDFMAMAEDQALANTPLALLAYWLSHHRSRLRSA